MLFLEILSKPRPVLIGEPTQKLKTSYITWNWQQELKELEKAYTGLKKNLFCIDETFAISEKPPTPRIEDDEEEIEAQIMNYYNDMLDTDEMDEIIAVQEIEEHQKKMKEEAEAAKDNTLDSNELCPVIKNNDISEEEKRLIEASAHDEDLRILPGMPAFSNPLPTPVQISSVFDQPSYNPQAANSYFPNSDNYSQTNSFNDTTSNNVLSTDSKSDVLPNYSESEALFAKQSSSEITATDVSNLVRQIRNGTTASISETTSSTSKPEYRDPRLNRPKDPRVLNTAGSSNNSQSPIVATTILEEKSINKPFIKIWNPNVIMEYKLALIKISTINYMSYFEYYKSDCALKNDPRLKKFFSTPIVDQKSTNDTEYAFSKSKIELESLMLLPTPNIPSMKKTTMVSPTVPNKILSPPEFKAKSDSETATSPTTSFSRDPRIRSKDIEHRRNSDSTEQIRSSPNNDEKANQMTDIGIEKSLSSIRGNEITNNTSSLITSSTVEALNTSTIPSYAKAAISTNSFFSPFSNFSSNEYTTNQSSLITNENNFSNTAESLDENKLINNALLVDEGEEDLKIDLDQTINESETPTEKSITLNAWTLNVSYY